jgi:Flp pilus assembly protein TadB
VHGPSDRDRPRSLRERVVSAWRDQAGATRTRPIFISSVCAGVIGFTLASALHLNALVAYVITVLAVFAVATAVLVWRDPGA